MGVGILLPAFGRPEAWRRALVYAAMFVAAVFLLTGTPMPAAAVTRPLPARVAVRVEAEPATADTATLTAPDPVTARTIARLEGQPVEVMSERTETREVYALPDGTMLMGSASGPVWVRRGGDGTDPADWAPVDLTLVSSADGAVRPVAHVGDLTFSGGSSEGAARPLAQLTDSRSGATTQVAWDGPLPAPELSGRRATYHDVRPGVDMVLEATSTGFEQFFVLRERPPASEDVVLPLALLAEGGSLTSSDDGGLELVVDGAPVATLPTPLMWDAETDAARPFPVSEPAPAEAGQARMAPMPGEMQRRHGVGRAEVVVPEVAEAPAPVGEVAGRPTEGGGVEVERTVEVAPGDASVVLTPQQDFLQDPDTTYPVVIDPEVTLDFQFDTYVLTGTTSDRSGETELLVGTYDSGAHIARSFVQFDVTKIRQAVVTDASLWLYGFHSWSCTARGWDVWSTRAVSTATRWTNQPIWSTYWTTSTQTRGYSSACAPGWVSAPVASLMATYAAGAYTIGTIGLRASSETDNFGWKRFYSADHGTYVPTIWVTYTNRRPEIAGTPQVSPAGSTLNGVRYTSTATPQLSAAVADLDGGNVLARFQVLDGATVVCTMDGTAPAGGTAKVTVPAGCMVPGKTYTTRAATHDGKNWNGAWSTEVKVQVDASAPRAPYVTSTAYPDDGAWHGDVNQQGSFTFRLPQQDTSVVAYRWGLDKAPDPAQQVAVASGADGALSLTPKTPGPHVLQVQSVDVAGNVSGISRHTFRVGQAGILAPAEATQVVRRVRLTVGAVPTAQVVRFEWRRGPDSPVDEIHDVPIGHLSTSTGVPWTTRWGALPPESGYTTWDAGATLGFLGGPLQVRAQVSAADSGQPEYATQWVTLTVDPDADGAATAGIGPGSVNLLTGDHYLSATDVEEFGIALTRSSSSRDPDAGYELQADRLTVSQQQATAVTGVTDAGAHATVDQTRFHDGTTSFKLTPTSPSGASFVTLSGDTNGMNLRPGRRYRFSGWVLVPSATGTVPTGADPLAMSMALVTRVGTGELSQPSVAAGTATAAPPVANAWQQVTFDATIPDGATEFYLRLYNGFTAASGQVVYWDDLSVRELWSPFGPQWSVGIFDGAAGTAYDRLTRPTDDSAAVQLAGGGQIWFTSGDNGATWSPQPGAEDLTLTKVSSTTWRLTELDGTVTVFAQVAGGTDFPVASSAPPAAPGTSRYVYDTEAVPGVMRLSRVIAPTEPGIGECHPSTGSPAAGCEILELTYATQTTASGTSLGTYAGRVSAARVWSTEPGASNATPVTVAEYLYDDAGRLREVFDPRIEAAGNARLTTSYEYDADGRVVSVTASGEAPWRFGYGPAGASLTGTGDWIDASNGRLLTVTRASLVPGTTDQWGPDNTSTVVYGVPLLRADGGPYDLTGTALDSWAQTNGPVDATAVFGPETPPGVTTATSTTPGPSGYRTATVHYLDPSGREVNTASPLPLNGPTQGYIDTAEYDRFGNVVRTLDATNRLLALKVLPGAVASLTEWGVQDRTSAELAQLLDARTVYSADGLDIVREVGPIQKLVSAETGAEQMLRPTTTTTYDEGKPDGVTYHLPTTVTTFGTDPFTGAAFDTVRMVYGYDPIDGADELAPTSGWVHKQATEVTVDAGGPSALTSRVRYDDKGRVLESQRPGSTGSDAGTTTTVYYTAITNPADPQCADRPEWAGQPCLTRAAGPVTGHDPARMAGQLSQKRITGYNRYGTPTVVTETVTGPVNGATVTQTRTTTTTYDAADRVVTVAIEGTGTGVGAPVATTRSVYDDTGEVVQVQSLTGGQDVPQVARSYDALGRLVSYTDADAGTTTTTYDRYGRPVTETQTQGAQTIGTRTFGYDSTVEPRGFLTSITDSVAGTITATWGPDGQLETETLPGGITLSIGYDPARVPTSRVYARASDGVEIWRDEVVENHRGQWVRHTSTTGTAEYTYDRLGRLVRAVDVVAAGGPCTVNTYGYDTHTNRTSFTTATGDRGGVCPTAPTTTLTSTYDSADRLVSGFGGSGWTYDPLGRTTVMPDGDGSGIVKNEFYVNDLIAAQEVTDQSRVEWTLDPLQRRSRYEEFAWVNGAPASSITKVSHYASDSDEPAWILEDSTLPSDVTRYVSGVEGGLAVTTTLTGGRVVQLVDLHGDVVGTVPIADGASVATWTGLALYRADEFGNPVDLSTDSSGPASPGRYGWLGGFQRSGEALGGVILMGVRLYQPATGRFMSVDPVPGGSASAYDYCAADPVNCTDLAGTFSFGSLLKVVSTVAEIASNIPGPIGAASAAVGAVAYAAQGNTAKAIEMGITAAAALVGAGAVVKVAARAVNVARAAGQAVRAAPRVSRAAQSLRTAAGRARDAVQRASSTFRRSPRSCPISSFTAGTLVVMADGTLAPIETLETGDLIVSTDTATGELVIEPIIAPRQSTGEKHLVDIVTDAGTWTATWNHPIWVDGKGWTNAIDIQLGDQLRGSTGGLLVVQAMHDRGWLSGQTVYNLTVAGTHTYYIAMPDGSVDALVHNCGGASAAAGWLANARALAGSGRAVFTSVRSSSIAQAKRLQRAIIDSGVLQRAGYACRPGRTCGVGNHLHVRISKSGRDVGVIHIRFRGGRR